MEQIYPINKSFLFGTFMSGCVGRVTEIKTLVRMSLKELIFGNTEI